MNEQEKYVNIYSGELAAYYKANDNDGIIDGGYGRRMWGENALEFLKQAKAQSVLDVGCGYGRFCDAVNQFVPIVYGADIASVKTSNIIQNPRIKYLDREAKLIDLPDNSVEWITSFDCLEHCLETDIDAIMKNFNRMATKGFVFSISYDPCHCNGIPLHMTVKPQQWWIDKIKIYGKVSLWGSVPILGTPYIICIK